MSDTIDLGLDHHGRFFGWWPDDLPSNRKRYGFPLPHVERAGLSIRHGECESAVTFDLPETRQHFDGQALWKIESPDPLTLSPSILCRRCGDHGFIRNGKWVPA